MFALVSLIMLITAQLWIIEDRPGLLFAFVVSLGLGFAGYSLIEMVGAQVRSFARDMIGRAAGAAQRRMPTVPRDWIELAIIAFILAGIGVAVWKGGAANPESTGSLGKKVNTMSSKVSTLSCGLGHLESEFAELKAEAATTEDVARIEQLMAEKFNTMRARSRATANWRNDPAWRRSHRAPADRERIGTVRDLADIQPPTRGWRSCARWPSRWMGSSMPC
jgi:outer membrane murein-binding lipoprotein Lpp